MAKTFAKSKEQTTACLVYSAFASTSAVYFLNFCPAVVARQKVSGRVGREFEDGRWLIIFETSRHIDLAQRHKKNVSWLFLRNLPSSAISDLVGGHFFSFFFLLFFSPVITHVARDVASFLHNPPRFFGSQTQYNYK